MMIKKKSLSLIIFIVAILFMAFFGMTQITAEAEISGKEIESYILTGYQGYYPYHYFDSLSNAEYSNAKIDYFNANGEKTSEFRAIEQDFSKIFESEFAKGSSRINLAGEMQALASSGHYYAYAKAGLLALNEKISSRVIISLSSSMGTKSVASSKVHSSGVYAPDWVKTDRVFLKNSEDSLVFQFSTLEKATILTNAKFYIFEPSVNFGIEIDKINNATQNSVVTKGQTVKLSASTFLSALEGSSLIKYYQNLHEITWEIVSGAENGEIVGNYLNVKGDAGSISVRPKCLKYSDSDEYIYGDTTTFTINSTKLSVSARSNFEDGASVIGVGTYNANRYVNVFITLNEGYSLYNVTDETGKVLDVSLKPSGAFGVRVYLENQSKVLNINLIKDVQIDSIKIKDKTYDKSNLAEIEQIYLKDASLGLGVNFDLSDVQATFSSIYPQNDIKVNLNGKIQLSGENAKYYNLINKITSTTGNILKRNIQVIANDLSIQYGENIPTLSYTLIGKMLDGDSLAGALNVSTSGAIGTYSISQGTLFNSYYEIEFIPATLTITKRKINISDIYFDNKTYDGTTIISKNLIHYSQNGVLLSNTDAKLEYFANFDDAKAQKDKKVTYSFELVGEDKNLYELTVEQKEISSSILEKEILIKPDLKEKVYGEIDPDLSYSYDHSQLVNGDFISGNITRTSGEEVGSYQILIGTLKAENYRLVLSNTNFTIKPKKLSIIAYDNEKIYGENDPEFNYSITSGELLNNDKLGLSLRRTAGETVGTYNIIINSQLNKNYQIDFTPGQFSIKKRDLEIIIIPQNKQYDGNTNCELEITLRNDILIDQIKVNLIAKFTSKNVGEYNISYYYLNDNLVETFDSRVLSGSNISCYNLHFQYSNVSKIEKREISINLISGVNYKEYGDQDPELAFEVINGTGEVLLGNLARQSGEEVGIYLINHGTLTEENNPNYKINYDFDDEFIILKKIIKVCAPDKSILYLDQEGEIEYLVLNEDQSLKEYLTGSLTRESGNSVGIYNYLVGSLKIIEEKSNHYELEFLGGKLTIEKRSILITINSQTKTYGSNDPIFTYSHEPNINYNFDITLFREVGENVGNYMINANISDDNFDFVIQKGVLSITPAKITIKANDIVKVYGEEDPIFNYHLSSGTFKFDDNISSVLSGELSREAGESVASYNINIGNLKSTENYQIKFVPASLTIIKKDIKIVADDVIKFYNEQEPELTCKILGANALDELNVVLERQQGEEIGEYLINLKSVNDYNYNIEFISGKFSIKRRSVKIEVDYNSKIFDGTEEANLSYHISGDLKDKQDLIVNLTREHGKNVGKYLVTATCESALYDIEIVNNYFEIFKRDIKVVADSFNVTYGEQIPALTYQKFNDIENSDLIVNLYRTENMSVGKYSIFATFLNTDNYNIDYKSGILEINKAPIEIKIFDDEKIYGSADPVFKYQIISGEIINNDILSGNIIRSQGESVGEYQLISNLFNENYSITYTPAKFKILPKEILLITSVQNKVYDGTDVAILRTPTLSGVLQDDDVYFDYDRLSVAKFESKDVGNDIPVSVFGGQLSGEDANNYLLIRPTNLTANITNLEIYDQDIENVIIKAKSNNTNLSIGTALKTDIITEDIDKSNFESSKNIIDAYSLNLSLNGKDLEDCGKLNVSIKLKSKYYNNVQVYKINSDGSKTLMNSSVSEDLVSFETDELGTFVVLADNDGWINIVLIITLSFIVIIGAYFVIKYYKKKKNSKKSS